MTKEEKQTLYEYACNDINCGTFILLPQYVDELIAKYTKVYRRKLKRIKKENAELKLKLEALEGQTPWKDIKDKSEVIGKLTKAKEIIELILSDNRTMEAQFESEEQANIWFEHIHQAEQFLKGKADESKN